MGESPDWRSELEALLSAEGFVTYSVSHLGLVSPMLAGGMVQAVFLAARPLLATDLLLLQRIRETSPRTAIVAVTKTPSDPDLKRAFESGATAFLSWPATRDTVRRAIDRGTLVPSTTSRR